MLYFKDRQRKGQNSRGRRMFNAEVNNALNKLKRFLSFDFSRKGLFM